MRAVALILIPMTGALLSGCFFGGGSTACHKPQEYQSSTSVKSLEVPEDLNAPDDVGRLIIPEGEAQDQPIPKGEPCLDKPPDYFDNSPV